MNNWPKLASRSGRQNQKANKPHKSKRGAVKELLLFSRLGDEALDGHLANLPTSDPGLDMIKSDLIGRIASQNPHLYQRDIENIVNAIINEIVKALGRGDRVELRGFGAFSFKIRKAHKGRNPKTGAEVQVAQKVIPFFKTGKEMRARLNRETARSVD